MEWEYCTNKLHRYQVSQITKEEKRMKIGTKQILLFVVALTLLVVGYKHEELANLWSDKKVLDTTPTPGSTAASDNTQSDDTQNGAQDVFVNSTLPFATNRLERDSARAKAQETYESIVADQNASEDTKAEAYNQLLTSAQQAESESKVEGLIREKGFKDAFVCFSALGELDVLVKAETLTEIQVAQIADIIVRYTDLDYSAIHIRKVA